MTRYLDWWRANRLDADTGLLAAVFEETFVPYLGRAGEYAAVDTNVEVALGYGRAALLAEHWEISRRRKRCVGRKPLFLRLSRTICGVRRRNFPALFSNRAQAYPYEETAEGFYALADPAMPSARKSKMLTVLQAAGTLGGKIIR